MGALPEHYTPLTGQPNKEVPAWIAFDLNPGYDFGQAFSDSAVLSGTRLSLSAQNLFDRDPPVVLLGAARSSMRTTPTSTAAWCRCSFRRSSDRVSTNLCVTRPGWNGFSRAVTN